jgi:CheY-like chemotaxis protein/Flp pilus assembly protein TadD
LLYFRNNQANLLRRLINNGKTIMSNLKGLSTLLVEPNSGMRSSLHNMLNLCGIKKISHALNSGTAIRTIQSSQFDIILCEYDLGIGQDGQQLLEDIRHHKLIPLSTIFIMLTAERAYEKVVSAAELAPSDYLLKPFNADMLQERMEKAVEKHRIFKPIFQLMEQGALRNAIKVCGERQKQHPKFLVNFLRFRAELHIILGEPKEAEILYQSVFDLKAAGWAKLGLAKTHYMQGHFEESLGILNQLVQSNDKFMDAYDWLSKTHEALGDVENAKNTLSSAVNISPHAVRRLRKLGSLALDIGDIAVAESALKQVVNKAKFSEFRDPEDHVKLVDVLVTKGDHAQAQSVIRNLEKNLSNLPKTEACRAMSSVMLYSATKDTRLNIELEAAIIANKNIVGLSNEFKMNLAKSCLANNLDDSASDVIMDVMNNTNNKFTISKAIGIFENSGKGFLGSELLVKSKKEVTALLTLGAKKAKEGDYQGSLELMQTAASKSPDNPQVILNAALAALKYIENLGWDNKTGDLAKSLIGSAALLEPMNPRLKAIRSLYESLQIKYGISK